MDAWRTGAVANGNATDVLIAPEFRTELKLRFSRDDIHFHVVIDDLQKVISNENPTAAQQNPLSLKPPLYKVIDAGHDMNWDSYHRVEDINAYLKYLADTYPQMVELINIGNSTEGRPLNVVRITSANQSTDQPAVWIDGGR